MYVCVCALTLNCDSGTRVVRHVSSDELPAALQYRPLSVHAELRRRGMMGACWTR
jgi:hypothetical protein